MDINKEAQAHYDLGLEFAYVENHEEAIPEYDKAIKLEPKFAEAYFCRGTSKYYLNQYSDAIADLNNSIGFGLETDKQKAHAYFRRARAYYILQKHTEAIEDYNKALKLEPLFTGLYRHRGNALRFLRKHEEAKLDYKRAFDEYTEYIERSPEWYKPYRDIGLVLLALEKYGPSKEYFDKANKLEKVLHKEQSMEQNKIDAIKHYNLGNRFYKSERHSDAITAYNKAIWFDPELRMAYYNRGKSYETVGKHMHRMDEHKIATDNYNKAMDDYNKAIALGPEHTDVHKTLELAVVALNKKMHN